MTQVIRALPPPPSHLLGHVPGAADRRTLEPTNGDRARDRANVQSLERFWNAEDRVEVDGERPRAKSFYHRIDRRDGQKGETTLWRPDTHRSEGAPNGDVAQAAIDSDTLDGLALGDPGRNAPQFIASLIVQSRLAQGLDNPPHQTANSAYRRAGAAPPAPKGEPRLFSFVI